MSERVHTGLQASTPDFSENGAQEPAEASSAAIYCQGLSKRYGEVLALDDLTLAVPYGSIFGFLGRNGAGKTTTMRLLSGLALPSAGRAWVAGLETTSASRQGRVTGTLHSSFSARYR